MKVKVKVTCKMTYLATVGSLHTIRIQANSGAMSPIPHIRYEPASGE